MPAIRAAAVMKNARQESLRRACRQDQAHGDRPKHTSWHFLAPPTASKLLIGSFCKDRTFAVVDENDRVWSSAAGGGDGRLMGRSCRTLLLNEMVAYHVEQTLQTFVGGLVDCLTLGETG